MKFKFLGDTKNMKVFGYDFSNGATPDVTDAKAIAKLQGNAEFEAIEDGKTFGSPVKEKKQKAVEPAQVEELDKDWPVSAPGEQPELQG